MLSKALNKIKYKLLRNIYSGEKLASQLGVKFGKNCKINKDISFGSEPYLITIGDNFYSSTGIKFVTHDGSVNVIRNIYAEYKDVDLIKRIKVGNNVFIGINTVILPGSIIGDNVIIGAGSVVKGKLDDDSVYAGVPCKKISSLEDYILRNRQNFYNSRTLSPKEKLKYLSDKL